MSVNSQIKISDSQINELIDWIAKGLDEPEIPDKFRISCLVRGYLNSKDPLSNEYGFWKKTGTFVAKGLPLNSCSCNKTPKIKCEYDGTIGFKETTYIIFCDTCNTKTALTSDIEGVIEDWNDLCGIPF